MDLDRRQHWEEVYSTWQPEHTSWHQPVPRISLRMVSNAGIDRQAPIIDVGGGASQLVDHLLKLGYRDLTVLDLSKNALQQVKQRLGKDSARVRWIESDVTAFCPERGYRLWHDRAALHFLTETADQRRYVAALKESLQPGGQAIIAAFAPDGHTRCSGLDVVRYDDCKLERLLGAEFILVEQAPETHLTPAGTEQKFRFYRFERKA